MKPKLLAIGIAAVLLVGGGALALTRFMAPSTDDALSFVPPDAYFYANVFVDPSNGQKQALDDFLQKFPGIESTDDVIEMLTNLLDDSLEEEGLDYEEDVKPWLGDQLAIFGIPGGTPELPNGAVLVESKDDAAARNFLDKAMPGPQNDVESKTYKGIEYELDGDGGAVAFTGGFLVAGFEDAVRASIDALESEDTLETSEAFEKATAPLADDWIGLFYVDPAGIFEEFAPSAMLTPEDQAALDIFDVENQPPQAAILYATSDSAVFEGTGSLAGAGPFAFLGLTADPGLVPELPADSWLAFGFPKLGELVTGFIEAFEGVQGFDMAQVEAMFYAETGLRLERDILSWLGDFGAFAQGTNLQEVAGGIVIESSDPAKTTALVEKVADLIEQQGVRPDPASMGGLEGFSLQMPGVPAPIYFLGGERLVIAYGEDATEAAATGEGTLAESEVFSAAQEAVGENFNISFFLEADGALALADAGMAFSAGENDTYTNKVKPYLEVFTYVVSAAKREGDTIVSKLVVGVE